MIGYVWRALSPKQRYVFWGVFILKLLASCTLGSRYSNDLFIPFVDFFVASGFQNPWEHFLHTQPDAFPYSGVMLLILAIPRIILAPFLTTGSVTWLHLLALRIPMLLADYAIWRVLVSWFPTRINRSMLLYWCSPIVFYISYIHGQIDSIPTAILVLSIAALIRERYWAAGLLYGAAIATKFHVLGAAPFMAIYLFKRTARLRNALPELLKFGASAAAVAIAGVLPFALDPAFRHMVFGSGESQAVFAYFVSVTPLIRFYVCPAAIVVLLIKFCTYSKTNRDMLILYCGLAFASLVLLLPPAPGWYFWSIPFVVYFFVRQSNVSTISYWALSISYFLYYVIRDRSRSLGIEEQMKFVESTAFTVVQTVLAFVIFWIYKIGVKSNEEYKSVRKSLLIGIGGDSSTGKHTFARSLGTLLGNQNVTHVNGDDYHKWPRGHESWQRVTHLNPAGNYLHLPFQHISSLKRGHFVRKSSYDHSTGTFTLPTEVEPKNFILYVGLHPFYLPRMRSALDLKIFMDTDEELRVAWKVSRDSKKRGYSAEQVMQQIEKRKVDGNQYIQPQRNFADLVIKYLPKRTPITDFDPEIKVQYTLRSDFNIEPVIERLSSVESLELSWEYLPDMERQQVTVSGTIDAERINQIAYESFPNIEEITMSRPAWESDIYGLNQLITVATLSEMLQG